MSWQPRERWATGVLVALVGLGALFLGYRQYRAEAVGVTVGLETGPGQVSPAGERAAAKVPVPATVDGAASGLRPEAAAVAELVVHVSGAVERPGVYRLKLGSRVHDAVLAAVPTQEAVPHALNLAAPLRDGEKVYVPGVSDLTEADAGVPPEALGADHAPGGKVAAGATGGPLDLNRAGAEELTAVPGIGPALARRIVEYRESAGGFRQVEDLLAVSGIGPAKLAQIKEYLEVR